MSPVGRHTTESFERLASFAADHPRSVVAAFLLATVATAPGIFRLDLRTDGGALVSEDSPAVLTDRELRTRFDLRDLIAVIVERRDGIFEPRTLAEVVSLTRALEGIEALGPGSVTSLATEKSDHVRPGTLDFIPWLESIPEDQAGLEALRTSLEDLGIYRGTLLSSDSPPSATAILVRVPPEERGRTVSSIRSLVHESVQASGASTLRIVGAPVAESELGRHVLGDLAALLPIALLAMMAVFWLGFRCLAAALLPLLEVGCALVVVFGAMGWMGSPVYLTTPVLPVILSAVGVTDELHVLTAFLVQGRRTESTRERAVRTVGGLGPAMASTSLTTAIGFGAFALSPLPPVRSFGLYLALGVLFCSAWSLVLMPALLAVLPASIWAGQRRSRAASARPARFLCRLGVWSCRRRWLVLTGLACATIACAVLAARIRVDDSWVAGFAPSSDVRRDTAAVEEGFGGTHLLWIALEGESIRAEGALTRDALGPRRVRIPWESRPDENALPGHRLTLLLERPGHAPEPFSAHISSAAGADGFVELELDPGEPDPCARWPSAAAEGRWKIDGEDRCLQPAVLARIRELETALAARGDLGVGRVLGPCELLETTRYLLRARDARARRLPATAAETAVVVEHYRSARGASELARWLEGDGRSMLMTAFVRGASLARMSRLSEWVRVHAAEHLEPFGIGVRLGGDTIVSRSLVKGIVDSQLVSLGFGICGVLITLVFLERSFLLAWPAVLPAGLAVLANLAFLATTETPIGVATSMFSSITIGIGVDYAIHLSTHLRRAAPGTAPVTALRHALLRVTPAMLLDVLSVSAAFGLLVLSAVPANHSLAALVLVGLWTTFAATITGLSALAPLFVRSA